MWLITAVMIIVEAVGGARAIVNLEPRLRGTKFLENEFKLNFRNYTLESTKC